MKKIIPFLLALLLCNSAFAQSSTTHFSLSQPAIGNTTSWGLSWNSNASTIDTALWNASGGLSVAPNISSSASTITLTNPLDSIQNVTLTAPGQALVLPVMNASGSMITGGVLTINNNGSNAFEIFAQDGTTPVLTSLAAGATAYITLLTNGTANGTFQVNTYFPYAAVVPVTQGGTGTSTQFTTGSVVFAGSSGVYNQDNANFFWDVANHRLGIGTAVPTSNLTVVGSSSVSGNTALGGELTVVGSTGIGTATPAYQLDVRGTAGSTLASNQLPVINKINVRTFTAGGTYTPTAGTQYVIVEMVGGGGGGGGVTTGNNVGVSGGAGGYIKALVTAAQISTSQTVTIGAAGTAGSNSGGNGGNGGTTSLGSLLSCAGGSGGSGGQTANTVAGVSGGAATVTTGTAIVAQTGGSSGYSASNGSFGGFTGNGGSNPLGQGSPPIYATGPQSVAGLASTGYGSGGGGACNGNSTAQTGSVGGAGYMSITEYISD